MIYSTYPVCSKYKLTHFKHRITFVIIVLFVYLVKVFNSDYLWDHVCFEIIVIRRMYV